MFGIPLSSAPISVSDPHSAPCTAAPLCSSLCPSPPPSHLPLPQYLLLAAAATKAAALTAVGVGALSAIVWPAVIALQSSRANPEEWGAVAGVLQVRGWGRSGGQVRCLSPVLSTPHSSKHHT